MAGSSSRLAPIRRQAITLAGIAGNLVPATIGNIIGGSAIAAAYLLAFAPDDGAPSGAGDA